MVSTIIHQPRAAADDTQLSEGVARLVQELTDRVSQLADGPSRDLGADVSQPAGAVADAGPATDADAERFFGPLLQTLLPVVVNTVPTMMQALLGQRRALGLNAELDAHEVERDFSVVLSGLLQKAVEALPDVVATFSGQRDLARPQDPDEATQRWFLPLLTTVAPYLAQAVPGIVQAVTGDRDAFGGGAPVTSPEIADRFFPALFGPLSAGLMQSVPQVCDIFGSASRDLHLTFDAFSGQWMPAGDAIRMVESDIDDPAAVEFQLRQPYTTWFKGLEVRIGGTRVAELVCEGNARRESDVFRIEADRLSGAGFLRFVKAARFGVHTGFYELRGLEQKRGKRLVFEWLHD